MSKLPRWVAVFEEEAKKPLAVIGLKRDDIKQAAHDYRLLQGHEVLADHIPDATKMIEQPAPVPKAHEQQEPFGYFKPEPFGWTDCAETDEGAVALYERPPASKPWVGLTDEEVRELEKQFNAERVRTSDEEYLVIYPGDYWAWQRAIEAKLKDKNGY